MKGQSPSVDEDADVRTADTPNALGGIAFLVQSSYYRDLRGPRLLSVITNHS